MSQNGNGQPEVPVLPIETLYRSCHIAFDHLDDGAMILQFTPSVVTPQGMQLMPPALKFAFDKGGWENFKRQVEADGKLPPIEIARNMPGGPV